ncbi:SDR family oxidoreductase [Plesiomonas shigelloides]|uniref:SDR family oxidoreductase n=1 Tax=Plesiomonas shigelloides TaxID=703 RepID=UPI001261F1A8|nr:SDR family oxidoreductase [Plesiomonas shigelloides]KAB7674068.1 SDR family NAD(P)-dependent oxidoreductase [Plesiomonas shigelloides]
MDIRNKVVLITGAARGLGLLFARKAAAHGAKLVLWDINEAALNATTDDFAAEGHTVLHHVVDVSNLNAIQASAQDVINQFGGVDILFNNAGIIVGKPFWEHSHREINQTLAINTNALMHICREFLPGMLEKGEGRIVNIASAAGMVSNPKMSVYCGSKWAVIGWSDSVRLELEMAGYRNIKVTTVTPSYIDTGMFAGVKAPLLTPIQKPEAVVEKVWAGMLRGDAFVRTPGIVNLLPVIKGLLPRAAFDLICGHGMGIYRSMDKFSGHKT